MNTLPANNAADYVQSVTTEKTKAWAKETVKKAKAENYHPLTLIFHAAFKNKGGAV